jgi:hypothetical protein
MLSAEAWTSVIDKQRFRIAGHAAEPFWHSSMKPNPNEQTGTGDSRYQGTSGMVKGNPLA